MNIIRHISSSAAILAVAATIGCSDNKDDPIPKTPSEQTSSLRVTHAAADAPHVQISADGNVIDPMLPYDYGETTGVLALQEGDIDLAVNAVLADGSTAQVLSGSINLAADMHYEVFAIGSVADETLEILPLSMPADFDTSQVRVTVAHLTPAAPMVDVHVSEPGAELSAATVLGSFSYKETLGPVEIAAGDYQVRVTAAGDDEPLYDSGPLALSAGSDLVIGAIPNVAVTAQSRAEKSPIQLLIVSGDSASVASSIDDGAELRVVHNSADAPAVDVVVNDNFEAPLIADLGFPETTPYITVPADDYNVKVVAAGTQTAVIDADLDLVNGAIYSVHAFNVLDNIQPLVLLDTPRRVATEAQLRAIHGSTLAGSVDIYVTAEGAAIADAEPALAGVALGDDSGYLSLPEGRYDITITAAGTKTVALGPISGGFNNGGIYTVLARDTEQLAGVTAAFLDDVPDQ